MVATRGARFLDERCRSLLSHWNAEDVNHLHVHPILAQYFLCDCNPGQCESKCKAREADLYINVDGHVTSAIGLVHNVLCYPKYIPLLSMACKLVFYTVVEMSKTYPLLLGKDERIMKTDSQVREKIFDIVNGGLCCTPASFRDITERDSNCV